jgi:hypothetical protein
VVLGHVEEMIIERYRRMSVAEKLRRVTELTQAGQSLARLDVKRRHPHADEREVTLRVASRWLDAELKRRAFGWDVEREGY